jgi:ABC-2 type transport system ATP-binding protein
MLEIKNLCFKYDKKIILDNINITFEPGKIYGLIGSNGAGKTTLLNCLSTMVQPNSGQILYNGKSIYNNINYLNTATFLSEEEYIGFHSINSMARTLSSYKHKKANKSILEYLLNQFKLNPRTPIRKFSKGMRRLALFSVYASFDPKVFFLDEFLDGMDIVNRTEVKAFILKFLIDKETIIVISSHQTQDVADLCDEIILLHNHVVKQNTKLDDFKTNYVSLRLVFDRPINKADFEAQGLEIFKYQNDDGIVYITIKNTRDELEKVKKLNPLSVKKVDISLEEVIYHEF